MARVVVHTDIAAAPATVWAHLADVGSHADWMADAEEIRFTSTMRSGVGTTIDVATKVGPFRLNDTMAFTQWEEPHIMAVDHTGLVTGSGAFILEPTAAGTRMTWDEVLRFPWYLGGGLTAACAKPVLQWIWRANLRRLAVLVEAGSESPESID